MRSIKIMTLLFMQFILNNCMGQTSQIIDSLEQSHQSCLDNGKNMLGCSKLFYKQIDSVMNIAYQALHKKMSPSEFAKLKKEQIKWLSNRDYYFQNTPLDADENSLNTSDKKMVIIDKQSDFVKRRVLTLISELNQKKIKKCMHKQKPVTGKNL